MEPTTIIRVDKATVIIFSIIFLPLLFGGGAMVWQSEHVAQGIAFCTGYVFLVYWICAPSIELWPGHVGYRTLFRRSSIDLTTVSEVFTSANPSPTLVFQKEDGRVGLKFIIKPFSRQGLAALFRHIHQANPAIRLDAASEHMSRGDFRVVTRQAMTTTNLLRIALTVGTTTLGASLIKLLLQHR